MTEPHGTDFDQFADSYDDSLNRGISVSGEDKFYFSEGRVNWLRRCLEQLGETATHALDFGCGTGTSVRYLLDLPGVRMVIGTDASRKSLEVADATLRSPHARWIAIPDYIADGGSDLVFSSGVFHHIPPIERGAALRLVKDSLRPGGLFALWENNPWNPGTRYVMRRIPFDRDAIPLSATEACCLVRASGFEVIRVDFLFIFPRWLRWFRRLEPALSRLPLGAQYQVLCRRP